MTVTGGTFTYDGTTHSGGSAVVSGAGIVTGSAVLSYSGDQVNAGTYYVTAHYAGDANHTASDGAAVAITITKAVLGGFANTQNALNIAKQGALNFALSNFTGLQNGESLVTALTGLTVTLKMAKAGGGFNTYTFQPSVVIDTKGTATTADDVVRLTYSMKAGTAGAAELVADLIALDKADGVDSTSASNASVSAIWVNMSSNNYTFCDDATTRVF